MTNIRAERVVISRRGRKIKRIEEEIKRRGEGRGGNGTTDRQQRPSGEGDIVRIRLLRWRQIPLWILCLSIRGILVIKGSGVLRSFLLSHPVSDCCSHPEPSMRFHAPLRFVPPPFIFWSISLERFVSVLMFMNYFFNLLFLQSIGNMILTILDNNRNNIRKEREEEILRIDLENVSLQFQILVESFTSRGWSHKCMRLLIPPRAHRSSSFESSVFIFGEG